MGYLTFYGDDNVEVPEGFLAETTAGVQYVTLRAGVITDGSVTLPASAAVAGPDGNSAPQKDSERGSDSQIGLGAEQFTCLVLQGIQQLRIGRTPKAGCSMSRSEPG